MWQFRPRDRRWGWAGLALLAGLLAAMVYRSWTPVTHGEAETRGQATASLTPRAPDWGNGPAVATPAEANHSYYVDSIKGSDSNPGTSARAPWASLEPLNAIDFEPDDLIHLARGSVWTGPGGDTAALTVKGRGEPGHPITIQAYGDGPAPVLSNPSPQGSDVVRVMAPWVVVQDLHLSDAHQAGIYLRPGADHAVVRDNEADQVGAGVIVASQYSLITGNRIHDTHMINNDPAPNSNYGAHGVLLHASFSEISYNQFVNCKAASLNYGYDGGAVEIFGDVDNVTVHHNYSYSSQGFVEAGGGAARHVMLAYNVIVASGPVAGLHASGQFGSVIDGFEVVNNTVVDVSDAGAHSLFYVEGRLNAPAAFVVRNNIFWINNYALLMQNSQDFTHDHNLYYFTGRKPQINYTLAANEKVADPSFVDLTSGDYRLLASSPAVNAGAQVGTIPWTVDGRPLFGSSEGHLGALPAVLSP